jgi:hypothetical protein
VRPARPKVRPWLAVVAVVVATLAAAWPERGYWLDPVIAWCHGPNSGDPRDSSSPERLIEQNRELSNALAAAQRGTRTERQTREDLRVELQRLEAEVLSLKREVAFYRRVMAAQGAPGLRVQSLMLEPLARDRMFRYRLLLTQFGKQVRPARGRLRLTIHGMSKGKREQLGLRAVATAPRDELDFDFRYFQSLEGDLLLPEGFQPLNVEVELKTAGEKPVTVRRTFDWATDGIGGTHVG